MTPAQIATGRPQWGNLVAAITTLAAADIAFGLTFPLLAILLEERHVDASMIGLNAAMSPLGLIVAGPFIPSLAARLGPKTLAQLAILMTAAALVAFKVFPS